MHEVGRRGNCMPEPNALAGARVGRSKGRRRASECASGRPAMGGEDERGKQRLMEARLE